VEFDSSLAGAGPISKRVETITLSASHYQDKALRSLGKLPPFSPILNKLMGTLADEDVSFGELADLIEKDTVLAGNVLRMVNSALYGRRGTINSVRHAVSLIGLSKLRNVTMSLSLARMWSSQTAVKGWFPAPFNQHSVACAILADLLATEMPVDYPEGAFTAGLLGNIGMMLIALSLPEERNMIQENYTTTSASLTDCERTVLQLTHAELSAEGLRHWNLPAPIQTAVLHHHGPHPDSEGGIAMSFVLEQADRIVQQHGIVVQPWLRPAEGVPAETLSPLGVSNRILESFQTEFESIRALFG